MDKIKKFLLKLTEKERIALLLIMQDICDLSLQGYDIKPLKGYKGFFRLRKGNIRIIFVKQGNTGIIIDIDFRKL